MMSHPLAELPMEEQWFEHGSSGFSLAVRLRDAPSAKARLWRSAETVAGAGLRSILPGRKDPAAVRARIAAAENCLQTSFCSNP
jgi:hypothetical protein